MSLWDDVPLKEKDLAAVEEILMGVEPIAQRQDLRISLEDISDLRSMHLGLTPKQIRFAYYYVLLKNGPMAALKAGYDDTSEENVTRHTTITANELMQKQGVRNLVHALQLRAATTLVIDEHYVVHMSAAIAENLDYKPKDRIEALKLITKIRGFEAPVRVQHDVNRNTDNANAPSALDTLHRVWQEKKGITEGTDDAMDAEVEEHA